MKTSIPIFLSLVAGGFAADSCAPTPPAPCNSAYCGCQYCLGPAKTQGNASTRPWTCNEDFEIMVAGFYWKSSEDGLQYALKTGVATLSQFNSDTALTVRAASNIITGEYLSPNFDWDFGFKIGIGYNSSCDGWDFNATYTWFRDHASSHDEAEDDDNQTLLPIWSAFAWVFGSPDGLPYVVSDIQTDWNLELQVVDIILGREFWVSKYLTMHPIIGFRIPFVDQSYQLEHRGKELNQVLEGSVVLQPALHNEVKLKNDFKGVGPIIGLATVWNVGCGFGLYGNLAMSIIYGCFDIQHDEYNRETVAPFSKNLILESKNGFRAGRGILDTVLGVQWATLFCNCQYRFKVALDWEQHLFFHQNQMFRITNQLRTQVSDGSSGQLVYNQTRGTLSMQGWTLTFVFDF